VLELTDKELKLMKNVKKNKVLENQNKIINYLTNDSEKFKCLGCILRDNDNYICCN
jgi:hypothetical protein